MTPARRRAPDSGSAGRAGERVGTIDPAATDESEALARLYDLDLSDAPGDLDLWLALASRTGGPVLELMAGSGRVAVPLAAAGYDVTAVDRDASMLGRAAEAAAAAGGKASRRLELVRADVDGLRLAGAGRHQLTFIALGSILLLPDRAAQRRAWETLAAHLAPGGVAAVDAWIPDGDDLARFDGRLTLDWIRTDAEGRVVTKTSSARHDAAAGAIELTTIFEEGRPGSAPVRWVRRDRLRLVDPPDLAAMATDAGLDVEVVAGDGDLAPFGPGSDRAIVVASRPAPRGRRRG
jgi:SAM-dependent methyltransferase